MLIEAHQSHEITSTGSASLPPNCQPNTTAVSVPQLLCLLGAVILGLQLPESPGATAPVTPVAAALIMHLLMAATSGGQTQ